MSQRKDFKYSMGFKGVDKLSSPLGKIQKSIGVTSKELRDLRKLEKQFGQFKTLRKNSAGTTAALKKAKNETAALGKTLSKIDKPTKKMTAAFKKAQKATHALKLKQSKEIAALAKLGKTLNAAGYRTLDFATSQRKLKSDILRSNTALDKQRRALKKTAAEYRKQKAAQAQYQRSLQTASNLGIVGASGVAVGTRTLRGTFGLVESIRPLEKAIGELQSLGVKNLQIYRNAAVQIDDQLAYTTADSFVRSAYDIRSGISALSDEGVAAITGMALVTARATKSTGEEMTSLTASAYGIFKNQYKDLSDVEWGEQFTAGLAASVKAYKTNGAAMQRAIQAAKGGAATLGMGMAEEMAILGTLQASMKGAEAGTALKSYAANAAKAHMAFKQDGVNINILDSEGMMRDTRLVLKDIRAQYGDLDAFEMLAIKKAFGTDEAVNLINALMENQTSYSVGFKQITAGMKQGNAYINEMARLMDSNADAEIQQSMEDWAAMKRDLGYALLPIFQDMIPVLKSVTGWISRFSKNHKTLVGVLGLAVVAFGLLATVMGALTLAMASMIGPFAVLKFAKASMIFKTGLLSKAMRGLGFAFKWVARTALPVLIAGMKVLARVFLLNPIGLAITAIATGAFLIIKYWKPISGWFGRMFKKLKTVFAFTPLGLLMRGLGKAFKWLAGIIKTPATTAKKTWSLLKTIFAWSPAGLLMRGLGAGFKWLRKQIKSPGTVAQKTWSLLKTTFAWSPMGLLNKGWKKMPDEFKAIFEAIKNIAIIAMQHVTNTMLPPLKMFRNFRRAVGGKNSAINRKQFKRGGSALKSGLGIGVLAAATPALATPAFAAQPPLPPFTQAAQAANASQTTQHNKFIINAAPGTDAEALARLVADKVADLDRQKARKSQGVLQDFED